MPDRAASLFTLLASIALLLLPASCGKSATQSMEKAEDSARLSFSLSVLPESFSVDPAKPARADQISISVSEAEERVRVDISAEAARDLKALYYTLDYDATRFSPVVAMATGLLGPTDRQLVLSVFSEPGKVHAGQLLANPVAATGFSGSGVLASVEFERKAFSGPARSASAAPLTAASRTTLELDAETQRLDWLYFSSGDYSQNFETNIGDLTPIGQHLNVSAAPEPLFALEDVKSVIDGDGNGLINITDLTPIGANFLNRVLSYNIYASGDFDNVPLNASDPSVIEPIGFVNFTEAVGNPAQLRLAYSFQLTEVSDGWFYWLRPCDGLDGEGSEGIPSTLVSNGGNPGNLSPAASFTADPQSGDAPLQVSFDASASLDSDGSIVQFAWDFDGNGSIDETGSTPVAEHEYSSPGLFEATLTVTDNGAAVDTATQQIQVADSGNLAPTADIVPSTQLGNAPLLVNFNAAASTDSDGSIVQFEWDFEGDGTFDANTGSIPEAVRTYADFGTFNPTVRVTDSGSLTDTASVEIVVEQVNQAPIAAIESDITEFDLQDGPPTITLDASLSSDLDGEIVGYRWDITGDGIVDHDSKGISTHSFVPAEEDVLTVSVEVTDNEGLSSSASVEITLRFKGEIRPVALLQVNPRHGAAPLDVSLDASGSFDPDGSIVSFEWDLDATGGFELNTGTVPQASLTLETEGLRPIRLKVTDNTGVGEIVTELVGAGDVSMAPTPKLIATPSSGSVPLAVTLDATSSFDPDGEIVKFEWSLDGLPGFELDSGTDSTQELTLVNAETRQVSLRITDDDDLSTLASVTLNAEDPGNEPPTAVISATPDSGSAPLAITLDASLSSDSDGAVLSYSWDINNDGFFDFTDQSSPTLSFHCSETGTHTAVVTVEDNDGASDSVSTEYSVAAGFNSTLIMENVELASEADTDQLLAVLVFGKGSQARANVAFVNRFDGDKDLTYVRADSLDASSWLSPVVVSDNANGIFPPALAIIGGEPALVFSEGNTSLHSSVRALDSIGSSWGEPQLIINQIIGSIAGQLFAAEDIAHFVGGSEPLRDFKAGDAGMTSWLAPQTVDTVRREQNSNCTVLRLGGKPAVFYSPFGASSKYTMRLAADEAASSWGGAVVLPLPLSQRLHIAATIADGHPAVCCIEDNGSFNSLLYVRALDSEGQQWPAEALTVYSGVEVDIEEPFAMATVSTLPGICFVSSARPQALMFVEALDSAGAAWGPAQLAGMGDFRQAGYGNAVRNQIMVALKVGEESGELICFTREVP